jgi:hypothetical protein
MEHRDDEELLLTKGTWGGAPVSFDDLQAMIREGIGSRRTYDADEIDAYIDDLLA